MKKEIMTLKCNGIIDRFKTGFINQRVPGVKDDYSKEFSITFTDYGRILKVVVSCAQVVEISDVDQPSDYIDFSLDSLTMEELMSQRLALHKAFTGGRAKINGNIFYGIKLAERLQGLMALQPLPISIPDEEPDCKVCCDHSEELVDVRIDENRSIPVRVGYRDDAECSGILFIFPPDPLMGGNSDNNIVTSLFNEAVTRGMVAVSFNYHGVESGRIRDDEMFAAWENMCETGDYSLIVNDSRCIIEKICMEFCSEAEIFLAGYSFGSYIALLTGSVGEKEREPRTVCISPPILEFPFTQLLGRKGVSVITSPTDEFCPLDSLKMESEKFKFDIEMIESQDHFFGGKEKQLADKVLEQIL